MLPPPMPPLITLPRERYNTPARFTPACSLMLTGRAMRTIAMHKLSGAAAMLIRFTLLMIPLLTPPLIFYHFPFYSTSPHFA